MTTMKLGVFSSIITITLGLAACGGGSSSDNSSSNTRMISGEITGFGSIHVGGNHIQTNGSTTYSVDGSSDDGSGLNVGDDVEICAEVQDNGDLLALDVVSNDELEGVVTSVPSAAPSCPESGSLTVLGIKVNYDADMVLDDNTSSGITTICELTVDVSLVEVHGRPGVDGIDATKIEVKSALDETEIKGTIDSIDTVAETLTINNLTFDYATASVDGLTLDDAAVGLFVEVKFEPTTLVETSPGNWTATADEIELEDDSAEGCSDEAEIEGVVTRGLGDDNGTPADTSDDLAADQFEINGSDIVQLNADLAADPSATALVVVGNEVEVEGSYDANGILVADEIEQEESGDLEFTGFIDSIVEQDTGTELTLVDDFDVNKTYLVTLSDGPIVMTFVVDPLNVTMDDSMDLFDSFDLGDVIPPSTAVVDIYYYLDGTDMIATKVELNSI